MVRKYKKVDKMYNEKIISIAIDNIETNESINKTAPKYHMSVSTL